jgi:hypothetical protein
MILVGPHRVGDILNLAVALGRDVVCARLESLIEWMEDHRGCRSLSQEGVSGCEE